VQECVVVAYSALIGGTKLISLILILYISLFCPLTLEVDLTKKFGFVSTKTISTATTKIGCCVKS
jgi:hypothetical protein